MFFAVAAEEFKRRGPEGCAAHLRMQPGDSAALHLCLKRIVTFYGACSNLPLRLVAARVHALPFAHNRDLFAHPPPSIGTLCPSQAHPQNYGRICKADFGH